MKILNGLKVKNKLMKTLKNFILAIAAWVLTSVSVLATDVIVVSHGQANDPFWSVAKNGVDAVDYSVLDVKLKRIK